MLQRQESFLIKKLDNEVSGGAEREAEIMQIELKRLIFINNFPEDGIISYDLFKRGIEKTYRIDPTQEDMTEMFSLLNSDEDPTFIKAADL
eukprot:UN28858